MEFNNSSNFLSTISIDCLLLILKTLTLIFTVSIKKNNSDINIEQFKLQSENIILNGWSFVSNDEIKLIFNNYNGENIINNDNSILSIFILKSKSDLNYLLEFLNNCYNFSKKFLINNKQNLYIELIDNLMISTCSLWTLTGFFVRLI